MPGKETLKILNEIRDHLEFHREVAAESPIGFKAGTHTERSFALARLRSDIGDCQRCMLHTHRHHLVFGSGNPYARLMFVGEAPGEEEDLQGDPFVGKAGHLLTRILWAMGLRRQDVYIANIIKCRPPGNRNPGSDEIETCAPFLRRQIEIISPMVICTLGTFASQTLLKTDRKISMLRGQFQSYEGIKVMPTYHPAYLLRNPQDKAPVWQDMQTIMRELSL